MNAETISTLITTLGFPIVCVIGLGAFILMIYKDTTKSNQENMDKVQDRCQEREDKLYEEIKANREVNASAIATIGLYADKLDMIQNDLSEIKTDIAILASKE